MDLLSILQVIVILIFIASLVNIAVQRLRMPYTVGLVLMGLGLAVTLLQVSEEFSEALDVRGILLPNLILTILVPPLIFEAAFHIKFEDLRRYLKEILAFAIPGVILTMLMVGGMITWGTSLSFEVALVFGALIAATDPVAVVALFRALGVPKQLLILLEGESLFNDGTAIVVFNLMLAIALGQAEYNTAIFLTNFVRVAGGGLIVGAVVSWALSLIISRINNHLVEVTLTVIAAYGAYLVAEELHVSGVLAVVMAGLILGNISERGMTPTTRLSLFNLWEFGAYLANSFAFLLIGLVIDLPALLANWKTILIAIAAVLLARAVIIYLLAYRFGDLPLRMQHVLYWGGLRGAISLALALSLPITLGEQTQTLLQQMTFGVVLFTLLVQGITMRPIIKRLGLSSRSPIQEAFEHQQARAYATKRAYDRVETLHAEGLISDHAWQIMDAPMRRQIEARSEAVREIMQTDRNVEVAEINIAFEEALRAQRGAYYNLLNSGNISEDTFSELVSEIDSVLVNKEFNYGYLLLRRNQDQPPITKLIFATLDQSDVDDTLIMMNIMGIPTTLMPSILGTGGKDHITLMMGVEDGQLEEVVEAILKCCAEPPVFRRGIFNLLPGPHGEEQFIEALNANVYVFSIEHYEEI